MKKDKVFDSEGSAGLNGPHLREIIEDGYKHADVLVEKEDFSKAYEYGERELKRVLHILPDKDFHNLLLQKITIELQYLASQSKFPPQQIQEKAAAIADYCHSRLREEEIRN